MNTGPRYQVTWSADVAWDANPNEVGVIWHNQATGVWEVLQIDGQVNARTYDFDPIGQVYDGMTVTDQISDLTTPNGFAIGRVTSTT